MAASCRQTDQRPTLNELRHSILRNFGGLKTIDPVHEFEQYINTDDWKKQHCTNDSNISPDTLIRASLTNQNAESGDGMQRYLLILTEAYAALGILQYYMEDMGDAITIFGSSFPKDQEYTQVNADLFWRRPSN